MGNRANIKDIKKFANDKANKIFSAKKDGRLKSYADLIYYGELNKPYADKRSCEKAGIIVKKSNWVLDVDTDDEKSRLFEQKLIKKGIVEDADYYFITKEECIKLIIWENRNILPEIADYIMKNRKQ